MSYAHALLSPSANLRAKVVTLRRSTISMTASFKASSHRGTFFSPAALGHTHSSCGRIYCPDDSLRPCPPYPVLPRVSGAPRKIFRAAAGSDHIPRSPCFVAGRLVTCTCSSSPSRRAFADALYSRAAMFPPRIWATCKYRHRACEDAPGDIGALPPVPAAVAHQLYCRLSHLAFQFVASCCGSRGTSPSDLTASGHSYKSSQISPG